MVIMLYYLPVLLENSLYRRLSEDVIMAEPHLTGIIEALRFREPIVDKLLASNAISLL